jgi:hypothetical protein
MDILESFIDIFFKFMFISLPHVVMIDIFQEKASICDS